VGADQVTEYRPRAAEPGDYDAIAAAIDEWWGRPVLSALPRLFLELFHHTSLMVDGPSGPVAFLVGILSPADRQQAYIHFVGVAPAQRRQHLAGLLYAEFFALARADGRTSVSAVTAPGNATSIRFHQAMGFSVSPPVPDYNGPGRELVVFRRGL
jgi:ribosomal protein S18 acetylase RimI-like enzyme